MTPVNYLSFYKTSILTEDASRLRNLDYYCRVMFTHRLTYEAVEKICGVPWAVIAAIHVRESDQSFQCHLHNGDPLTARTIHEPKNRPLGGQPPFTWIDSTVDVFHSLWRPHQWDMPGCLEFMERYNGLGYRERGVMTPYLWDYTSLYTSGLFIGDGTFDPEACEARAGCAALFKMLERKGVSLDFTALGAHGMGFH